MFNDDLLEEKIRADVEADEKHAKWVLVRLEEIEMELDQHDCHADEDDGCLCFELRDEQKELEMEAYGHC